MVERDLAKVEVAGSSPVIRSKIQKTHPIGWVFCIFALNYGCENPQGGAAGTVYFKCALALEMGQVRRFCEANGGV